MYEIAGTSAAASSGRHRTVSLCVGVTPTAPPVSINVGGKFEWCSSGSAEVDPVRSVVCATGCGAVLEGGGS